MRTSRVRTSNMYCCFIGLCATLEFEGVFSGEKCVRLREYILQSSFVG